jgi:hypothetical protein
MGQFLTTALHRSFEVRRTLLVRCAWSVKFAYMCRCSHAFSFDLS